MFVKIEIFSQIYFFHVKYFKLYSPHSYWITFDTKTHFLSENLSGACCVVLFIFFLFLQYITSNKTEMFWHTRKYYEYKKNIHIHTHVHAHTQTGTHEMSERKDMNTMDSHTPARIHTLLHAHIVHWHYKKHTHNTSNYKIVANYGTHTYVLCFSFILDRIICEFS